jgi:hypothetical protein
MHNRRKRVAGCHVNISSVAYVLDDLAEVDQIGWIENIADNGAHAAAGATEEPGWELRVIGRKHTIIREVPTNLLLYFANQSTPNSSLLLRVNCPITVLNDTCGALTSISSRIFSTFITTSRFQGR